jgi:hypothetical protein
MKKDHTTGAIQKSSRLGEKMPGRIPTLAMKKYYETVPKRL